MAGDSERKRIGCDHFAAFESHHVDALAKQDGAGGQATWRGRDG
jgi:hypothetical protein